MMIGFFEGIDSERGIAWRLADSLTLLPSGGGWGEGASTGVTLFACRENRRFRHRPLWALPGSRLYRLMTRA
jgi:hypothetical protein